MADLTDLWRPTRRDVKGLKEQLAVLEPETLVAAKFESGRYGRFIVEGTVQLSSGGELTIAGKFLGSDRSPSPSLLSFVPLGALPVGQSAERAHADHGAVVRASFENPGHGAFLITGVAVDAPVLGGTALGAWFLFHELCRSVELLAAPGAHDQPVPGRISALAEDTSEVM